VKVDDGDEISQSTAKTSGIRTQATKELFVGLCARGAGRRSLTLATCDIESIDQDVVRIRLIRQVLRFHYHQHVPEQIDQAQVAARPACIEHVGASRSPRSRRPRNRRLRHMAVNHIARIAHYETIAASVYVALIAFARKDFLKAHTGMPKPVQGGRGIRYWRVTPKGIAALAGAPRAVARLRQAANI
jgi:hypothetical protein